MSVVVSPNEVVQAPTKPQKNMRRDFALIYLVSRLIFYGIALVFVLLTDWLRDGTITPLGWFIVLFSIVAPFIFPLFNRLYPQHFERITEITFLMDVFMAGPFSNFMGVFTMTSGLFVSLTNTNTMSIGGIRLFLKGLALALVGFVFSGLLTGWVWYFDNRTLPWLNIASGVLLVVYAIYSAWIGFFRNVQLKNSRNQLKQQKLEIEQQRNQLVSLNETLNQKTEEIRMQAEALHQSHEELVSQSEILKDAFSTIERKNLDITDSIQYASRIQTAFLPSAGLLQAHLENYFILYRPRDIVSGDFYYFNQQADKLIIGVLDCTGHGVPGALMSMIGHTLLNQIIEDKNILAPEQILRHLHEGVRLLLRQYETQNRDGMDAALLVLDTKYQVAHFAGAKNPLVYIQNDQLIHLKGDKFAVGGDQREFSRSFTCHSFAYSADTIFYLFTDGYQDQFGGTEGKKFMIKRLKDLLFDIHQSPFDQQEISLLQNFQRWTNTAQERQIDDILIWGFKPKTTF